MNRIEKRLRILEIYAASSLILISALAIMAFAPQKRSFSEIDVERLNVVEKNGRLRLVIANSSRMPDPVVDGKAFKTERPPGILFYNGLGDEDGGLVFGAVASDDKYGAYHGLSFDQYKQSQILALVYDDHSGRRHAGLRIWDRPETPISEIIRRREEIAHMPEGDEKARAEESLRKADSSPTRVFVGKNVEEDAQVVLSDARGAARINIVVPAEGTPKLEFLNESGDVVYRLPDSK